VAARTSGRPVRALIDSGAAIRIDLAFCNWRPLQLGSGAHLNAHDPWNRCELWEP